MEPVNLKTCTKCKTNLPYWFFHKDNRSKDGYRSICKECRKNTKESKISYDPDATEHPTHVTGDSNAVVQWKALDEKLPGGIVLRKEKGLVSNMGKINGSDIPKRSRSFPGKKKIKRRKIKGKKPSRHLIAVGLALLLIGASLYVLNSIDSDPMQVDGEFDDWDDMYIYDDPKDYKPIDIRQYSVIQTPHRKFFYIGMDENFPDCTIEILIGYRNILQGYQYEDYSFHFMLQYMGNNAVLYVYNETEGGNKWESISSVKSEVKKSQFEAEIWNLDFVSHDKFNTTLEDILNMNYVFRVYDEKNADTTKIIISDYGGVIVTQAPIGESMKVSLEWYGPGSPDILSMDFINKGSASVKYTTFVNKMYKEYITIINTNAAKQGESYNVKVIVGSNHTVNYRGDSNRGYIGMPTRVYIDGVFGDWSNIKEIPMRASYDPSMTLTGHDSEDSYVYLSTQTNMLQGVHLFPAPTRANTTIPNNTTGHSLLADGTDKIIVGLNSGNENVIISGRDGVILFSTYIDRNGSSVNISVAVYDNEIEFDCGVFIYSARIEMWTWETQADSIKFSSDSVNTSGVKSPRTYIVDVNGNGDYTTLRSAIVAGIDNGDTIRIWDGTYYELENVIFNNQNNISIIGNGTETILSGHLNNTMVLFEIYDSTNITIANITIQDCKTGIEAERSTYLNISRVRFDNMTSYNFSLTDYSTDNWGYDSLYTNAFIDETSEFTAYGIPEYRFIFLPILWVPIMYFIKRKRGKTSEDTKG